MPHGQFNGASLYLCVSNPSEHSFYCCFNILLYCICRTCLSNPYNVQCSVCFPFIVVSAFYAEHQTKRITLDGYIWTKSKFLGLSIGVHMIGQGVVSVIDHDEEYVITFPNGYGR